MNKQDLDPRDVVVDLVLAYSAVMPRAGQAAVLDNARSFILCAKNHKGVPIALAVPIFFDGEPSDGNPDANIPPRFVLYKIAPTVWKLAPSIRHDMIHGFVTIVGVPEDVAWGTQKAMISYPRDPTRMETIVSPDDICPARGERYGLANHDHKGPS